MVNKYNIGVIAIQGAVTEHILTMEKALSDLNLNGKVIPIKSEDQLDNLNGLVIPGGESTTISRIIFKKNLHKKIIKKVEDQEIAVMGTCAGCVILSKEIDDNTKDIKLLRLVNMKVKRNYFGRQKESFEQIIKINGFKEPYNAVFIRAPIIKKVWDDCKILSKIDKKIVMIRQKNILALSFHPELTKDLRIHKYFLNIVTKLS